MAKADLEQFMQTTLTGRVTVGKRVGFAALRKKLPFGKRPESDAIESRCHPAE